MWTLKLLAFTIALLSFAGTTECGRRRNSRCSPRSCRVSSWSRWSQCSHRCGTSGTQTRKRKKTVAESCGGSCSFALSETRSCNTDNCQNSGTPTSQGCSCRPGYRGTCCEKGKLRNYIEKIVSYIKYTVCIMKVFGRRGPNVLLFVAMPSFVSQKGT